MQPKISPLYHLQDKFLTRFFTSPVSSGFYLTGGTALARFYLHHRESLDLDIFTNDHSKDLTPVVHFLQQFAKTLKFTIFHQLASATFVQYILKSDNHIYLKIDVVKDTPVHFGKRKRIESAIIDSIENIGANKILALLSRTESKDFIDLYYLLQETSLTFDYLFRLAQKKNPNLTKFNLAGMMDEFHTLVPQNFPQLFKELDIYHFTDFYEDLVHTLYLQIKPTN